MKDSTVILLGWLAAAALTVGTWSGVIALLRWAFST